MLRASLDHRGESSQFRLEWKHSTIFGKQICKYEIFRMQFDNFRRTNLLNDFCRMLFDIFRRANLHIRHLPNALIEHDSTKLYLLVSIIYCGHCFKKPSHVHKAGADYTCYFIYYQDIVIVYSEFKYANLITWLSNLHILFNNLSTDFIRILMRYIIIAYVETHK